jgi:TonB family protein
MLERITDAHLARRRHRLRPAALFSIAAHVAALIALLAYATWRVDKIQTIDTPVLLAAGINLPAPEAASPEPAVKPKPPGRRRELGQPTKVSKEPESDDDETGGEQSDAPYTGLAAGCPPGAECEASILDGVTPPVCGDGRVEGDEQCDDGGRAAGDGCSASCRREAAIVSPGLVEGRRIAGDPQIAAPESVRRQMSQDHQGRAVGTVKMCLDRDGNVSSLRVLRSTGYSQYDELLTSRMRGWRYRPYQLSSGAAVPVCTAVTFVYLLRP